jgi:hypothetical protein
MLTPDQLARRAAKELAGAERPWVDPDLVRDLPGLSGGAQALEGHPPGVALVRAERVSATGGILCGPAAAAALPGAGRVVAVMAHVDDTGSPRVVQGFDDGVTAQAVAHRVITDLCVLDVTETGMIVREVAPGTSAREVQLRTGAPLLAGPDLAPIEH